MKIPNLSANVERRLLISYRVDPDVIKNMIPNSFRLQLVDGYAVAGACLIRLGDVRPTYVKKGYGWGGENAAHRIAVEYNTFDGVKSGVFIPERHSNSLLPVLAGGRVFPGKHKLAKFAVDETEDNIKVALSSSSVSLSADVTVTDAFTSKLFPTLEEASDFYRNSPVGFSPDRNLKPEGLKLSTDAWKVEAGHMNSLSSTFFDSLPKGSVFFDHVLVMRNIPVTWSAP